MCWPYHVFFCIWCCSKNSLWKTNEHLITKMLPAQLLTNAYKKNTTYKCNMCRIRKCKLVIAADLVGHSYSSVNSYDDAAADDTCNWLLICWLLICFLFLPGTDFIIVLHELVSSLFCAMNREPISLLWNRNGKLFSCELLWYHHMKSLPFWYWTYILHRNNVQCKG